MTISSSSSSLDLARAKRGIELRRFLSLPLFLPFSLLSSARGQFTGEGESDRVGPTRQPLNARTDRVTVSALSLNGFLVLFGRGSREPGSLSAGPLVRFNEKPEPCASDIFFFFFLFLSFLR